MRFQLLSISVSGSATRAFIKDLLVGESRLLNVGETIGECKLLEISYAKGSIRLKPPSGPEFTVTRDLPAK